MATTRYTEAHEWARQIDGEIVIGITDYAQDQLGEVVFVELPEAGSSVEAGDDFAVIESVKAAGDVKAPIAGVIIAVNDALADDPGLINRDPMSEGWIARIQPTEDGEFESLLDEDAYAALIED
ncbi:glycine cleavage system protein GcvH [Gammaproteobacteria bacterium]|nr:glycine cleavage system protein GcvH [Gammaproteobacteria bacterium]